MRKDVDIVIKQTPRSVIFTCPHCKNEVDIEYNEFERITGNDLDCLLNELNDSICFNCPNCDGDLEIYGFELD